MLKIGEFSRLSHVTVKALRHYAELGLLKPAWTDRFSGYRYYSVQQLPRLNRILALKEMGFSLEQIAHFLAEDLSMEHMRALLDQKRAELRQRVQDEQLRLVQVENRLAQMAGESGQPAAEVALKRVPSLWVASLRERVRGECLADCQKELSARLTAWLEGCPLRPLGPWMLIQSLPAADLPDHDVELAVGVEAGPTRGMAVTDGPFHIDRLPAVDMMASVIQPAGEPLSSAYAALYGWAEQNACSADGPFRVLYLEEEGEKVALIEVQLPVRRLLAEPTLHPSIQKEGNPMEPKIVTKPAFMVMGMLYHGKNQNGEIGQMWDKMIPRFGEVPGVGPHVSYGVCYPLEESDDGAFDYIAGLEVASADQLPEGMVVRIVPAQTYAVFTLKGPLGKLPELYNYAYNVWLPQSGYKMIHQPDFEYYEEGRFNPTSPDSELEIYIPIGM